LNIPNSCSVSPSSLKTLAWILCRLKSLKMVSIRFQSCQYSIEGVDNLFLSFSKLKNLEELSLFISYPGKALSNLTSLGHAISELPKIRKLRIEITHSSLRNKAIKDFAPLITYKKSIMSLEFNFSDSPRVTSDGIDSLKRIKTFPVRPVYSE